MDISISLQFKVEAYNSKLYANTLSVSKIIFQIAVSENQKFSYFSYILTILSKSNIEMQMEISDYYLVSKTKYIWHDGSVWGFHKCVINV